MASACAYFVRAALAFAYIERVLRGPDPALDATVAISVLDSALPLLEGVGFDKFAYEDFYEELLGLLKRIGPQSPDPLTPAALLQAFQAPEGQYTRYLLASRMHLLY